MHWLPAKLDSSQPETSQLMNQQDIQARVQRLDALARLPSGW
jgi:hypothetical protein